MGWKKISSEEERAPHRCDIPVYKDEGIAEKDIIECDECGKQWKCVDIEYGMSYDPLPRPMLRWKGI